ncbi:MAG: hypothetical protein K2K85_02130 [Clostridia bacterium]|nr:hypothetical protein [Clostridia bacterium]
MEKAISIVEKLGLTSISQKTANKLLLALYSVEEEQGYLNESVTSLVSYLHLRQQQSGNKPTVFFESRGESGNIFALLGKVSQALNDEKAINELWKQIKQGTYIEAIQLIKQRVNLIDEDGVY